MRRLAAAAVAAAALAIAAAPSQAQTSWTGPYIGVNGGGTFGSLNPSASDTGPDSFFAGANVPAVTRGAGQHIYTSGGLAGGQVGYLYQWGQAILGADAAFDWSGLQGSTHNGPTTYPVTPGSTFSWNLKANQDWLATFLGRAGVDLGMWYPYVTAGIAVTSEKYKANFVDTFYPTNNTFSFSRTIGGPVLGAGAEIRFADHWLVRAEYLYMQFDGVHGAGTIACTAGVGACSTPANKTTFTFATSTFRQNVARIALSYKFGVPTPPPATPVAAPPAPPPAAVAPQKQMFIVFFEFDKSSLTADGRRVVDAAAAAFKSGRSGVAIAGYTDLSGTQQYNLALSKRRADTVKAALVRDGVPAAAIDESWHGKENPRVPTADGVREPQNRRVEITM